MSQKKTDKPDCNAFAFNAPAVLESLDCLTHYHQKHTSDTITKWTDTVDDKVKTVVMVTSNPEMIARLNAAFADEFAKGRHERAARPN